MVRRARTGKRGPEKKKRYKRASMPRAKTKMSRMGKFLIIAAGAGPGGSGLAAAAGLKKKRLEAADRTGARNGGEWKGRSGRQIEIGKN